MEKIENITLCSFVCKENHYILLICAYQLLFKAAKYHQKAVHRAFLGVIHVALFRCINDKSENFRSI